MNLSHRPTALQDLEACLPLIRNGFAFSPDERPQLLTLWQHLLTGGMAESAVVEDREGPEKTRIVGFGMSIFVTDDFAAQARAPLATHLARQVMCLRQEGRAPFLSAPQIRRANSGAGLNGLILHNGWVEEEAPTVRRMIMEAFLAHHCGYRLQCFLHEIYGAVERDKMAALGWHLENDYTTTGGCHCPGTHDHAYLMSLRREDAGDVFYPFYPLFNAPAPCLCFRPAEQTLLRRALRGESDAEIAAALDVSLFTIHKRWRAIYETTAERGAGLCLLPTSSGTGRGQEKRRLLLRYLEAHPEELRPFIPPVRAGR